LTARQSVSQLQQDLAGLTVRLEEARAAVSAGLERLTRQEAREQAAIADLIGQVNAANARADAADKRVALELERERQLRAKAERNLEALEGRSERDRAAFEARLCQIEARALASEQREAQLLQEMRAVQTGLATAAADLAASKKLVEEHAAAAAGARAEAAALQDVVGKLSKLQMAQLEQVALQASPVSGKPRRPTKPPQR
jgi:chromosome segregation ATPase